MNFRDFDFDALQDIPPLLRYYEAPRVSITTKGLFSINTALRKEVGNQREFRVKISPDCQYLALFPFESPNVRFSSKGGYIVHTPFAQHLEAQGLQLPVTYTMEWCQEQQAWIGCCQELSQPPAISSLSEPAKKSTRKSTVRREA